MVGSGSADLTGEQVMVVGYQQPVKHGSSQNKNDKSDYNLQPVSINFPSMTPGPKTMKSKIANL